MMPIMTRQFNLILSRHTISRCVGGATVGDVQMARGHLAEALKSYRDGFAIAHSRRAANSSRLRAFPWASRKPAMSRARRSQSHAASPRIKTIADLVRRQVAVIAARVAACEAASVVAQLGVKRCHTLRQFLDDREDFSHSHQHRLASY
jgi:hypothetical protein